MNTTSTPKKVAARRLAAGMAALATVLACAWTAGSTLRAEEAKSDAAGTIKKVFEGRFPGTKVLDVRPTPVTGIYEVFVGDRIVYSDASGDHLIIGNLIDTRSKADLTQASMDVRGKIDFKALPFDKAIKVVKGNGSRQLAVFEDPDCPYCQKLEQELLSIRDVTEYIFLFPIDQLHPQATRHARDIWCSKDAAQAWSAWLVEKKVPATAPATCKNDPIGELAKLGDKLNINGTPTSFLVDGRRVGGAVPLDELEKELTAASGPASKPAAGIAPPPGGPPAPAKAPAAPKPAG